MVFVSLHRGQLKSEEIPLVCRFSPVGRALCMVDQRKTFSFGENLPDQTSFTHLNSSSFGKNCEACLSAAAVAYRDLVE